MTLKKPDLSIKAGDKVTFDKPDDDYGYYNLTPGKEYTTKWIVCALDGKGNIKPASQPRIMASENQAVAVSKSMASQYQGETFAAVSFTIGATFRAEAVEVKTVTYFVRQVG